MSKVIYQPWSEWDLGLEGRLFTTKDAAWEAVKKAHKDCDVEDSFEDCKSDGLYGVEEMLLEG